MTASEAASGESEKRSPSPIGLDRMELSDLDTLYGTLPCSHREIRVSYPSRLGYARERRGERDPDIRLTSDIVHVQTGFECCLGLSEGDESEATLTAE